MKTIVMVWLMVMMMMVMVVMIMMKKFVFMSAGKAVITQGESECLLGPNSYCRHDDYDSDGNDHDDDYE